MAEALTPRALLIDIVQTAFACRGHLSIERLSTQIVDSLLDQLAEDADRSAEDVMTLTGFLNSYREK